MIADGEIIAPLEIAYKVIAYASRRGQPKSGTDWRDIMMLLIAFPEYKSVEGLVRETLISNNATSEALVCWTELANADLSLPDDDAY